MIAPVSICEQKRIPNDVIYGSHLRLDRIRVSDDGSLGAANDFPTGIPQTEGQVNLFPIKKKWLEKEAVDINASLVSEKKKRSGRVIRRLYVSRMLSGPFVYQPPQFQRIV